MSGRRLVMVYVAIQVAIPIAALIVRWTTPDACFVPYGWQMFSCAP